MAELMYRLTDRVHKQGVCSDIAQHVVTFYITIPTSVAENEHCAYKCVTATDGGIVV